MKTIISTMMAALMVLMPLTAEAKTRPFHDLMSRTDSRHCVASAVYYEALGEDRNGKVAVASVIMNRVKSGKYAPTPCEVVYQKGQFSWINPRYRTHIYDEAMWQESLKVADLVLAGKVRDNTGGALYFHARRVHPRDVRHHPVLAMIGQHIFVK
jgi:spore germination cell wall hydrolase CwlJ-like protein